jgi:ATP-dependent Clp protease ATP-binding subunit ClpC
VKSAAFVSESENHSGNLPFEHLSSLLKLSLLHARCHEIVGEDLLTTPSIDCTIRSALGMLHRSRGHNVYLVGPHGCGKSSMLQILADTILENEIGYLAGIPVVYMNVENVGPEDSRAVLETLWAGISKYSELVLLIDGMASLFPRPAGGSNKPLLRMFLSRPGLRMVGTMVAGEYNELVANDIRMLSLSNRLDCCRLTPEELMKIASCFADSLAHRVGIQITESTVQQTISMASTFLVGDTEPSRTIEVLRRAVDDLLFDKNTLNSDTNARVLEPENVASIISRQSGVPIETLMGHHHNRNFTAALTGSVVGQPRAVREVAIELEMIAAGLNEPGKPATVLMFAGMTGVGKTELAKQIARLYSPTAKLTVYPMGNFTEPHSVAGLIGVPPGYVGHEEGGRLVNDLLADPFSVFLLDEAEKCHPNVWKPFLNLFDEGWIVDRRGRKAYGDRAVFILTTNAGDRSIAQLQRTNKSDIEVADHVRKTLSRVRQERSSQPVFPPQFLSRIRRIIVFSPLEEEAMVEISRICVEKIGVRWQLSRNKSMSVTPEVVEWIGREAFRLNGIANGEEGGRIVQKLVSEKIEYEILRLAITQPEAYEKCRHIIVSMLSATSSDLPEVDTGIQIQFT